MQKKKTPSAQSLNNDELDQLLASCKLARVREIIAQELQSAASAQPAYSDFLSGLLRQEFLHRQQKSLEYRIAQARLPEFWPIETFPFKRQPSINAAAIREFAKLDFIQRAANITFIGPTGVGKTGLASGILIKALENGYRGYFVKAQDHLR